ncbi:MAG: hypothetical protein ACI8UX_002125 [Psychromonas sp.]
MILELAMIFPIYYFDNFSTKIQTGFSSER